MRSDIYLTLAIPLRRLVEEIEDATGFEIEVRHRSRRSEPVGDAGDGTVGSIASHDSAVIEYDRALSDISEDDYAHELLHLHRFYVQAAPQLVPKDFRLHAEAAAVLGNWIEHVIIYKQQRVISPTLGGKLERGMAEAWSNYPWGACNEATRRFHTLIKYLITDTHASDNVKRLMRTALSNDKTLSRTRVAAQRAARLIENPMRIRPAS